MKETKRPKRVTAPVMPSSIDVMVNDNKSQKEPFSPPFVNDTHQYRVPMNNKS